MGWSRALTWVVPALAAVALATSAASRPALDAKLQRETVEGVARAMRTAYVLPDVGERAAARVEAELAAGSYASISDPAAFAERLTADLRREAPDLHLRVNAMLPPPPPPASAPATEPAGPPPRYPGEAGVMRADILPGEVGYLQLASFTRSSHSMGPPLDRAMAALAGTRALIIDLRGNGGGGPGGGHYLLSQFLPAGKPVLIGRRLERTAGTTAYATTEFRSLPVPRRYLGKPVYVLIGPRTFSGGELFAYDMQAMKLARLVGQTTRGGAHGSGPFPINSVFVMSLPTERYVSPVTGENWEGKGLTPDLAAPGPEALRAALNALGVETSLTDVAALSQRRVFAPRMAPLPGAEATLRRVLEGFAAGRPAFDAMGPAFRKAVEPQLDAARNEYGPDGAVQAMAYVSPDPEGMDIFDVTFANGTRNCRILLDSAGRTEAQFCGPRRARAP